MTKPEVRYLKGDPTHIYPAVEGGTAESSNYDVDTPPLDHDYYAYGGKDAVVAVMCTGNNAIACERIAGLGPGSNEAEVKAVLGAPNEDRPPTEKGRKTLSYGSGKARLDFFLSREHVDEMAIHAAKYGRSPPDPTPRIR
jgi:hypothetical protein